MPFDRDTRVVPSNIVLDRGPSPPTERNIWGSEPPIRSDGAYRQMPFTCIVVVVHWLNATQATTLQGLCQRVANKHVRRK